MLRIVLEKNFYNPWPDFTITNSKIVPPIRDEIEIVGKWALVRDSKSTQHHRLFAIKTSVST